MKFTVKDFDDFMTCITEVQAVCEDTNNSEELKNIIFQLSDGNMYLAGLSPQIQYRRKLLADKGYEFDAEDTPLQNGYLYLQIKSKDLISFLSTYKASRVTQVKNIVFDFNDRGKIRLTITEGYRDSSSSASEKPAEGMNMLDDLDIPEPVEPVSEKKDMVSRYLFDNVPMVARNIKLLDTVTNNDAEYKELDPNILNLYTKTLTVGSERTVYSYMNFTQDWVFVLSPSYVSFVKNLFEDKTVFSGIRLSSRVVNFFQKVLCTSAVTGTAVADGVSMLNNIDVARTDRSLLFKTATVEASCTYDTNVVDASIYFNMYVDENGNYHNENSVVLDRVLFKDIVKRLSLKHDLTTVEFNGENKTISLSNPAYSQTLIPEKFTGFIDGNITFEIMPDVLSKSILGADSGDSSFEEGISTVRISFSDGNGEKKRQGIVMSDSSDAWFSIIRVKVRQ